MSRVSLLFAVLLLVLCSSQLMYAGAADTSCGIIWDEPILLSDTNYNAHSPRIALSGEDTVHITWENAGQFRLPYVRSLDGGTALLPTRELISDSMQFPGQATWMHITAQNQIVYVFFRTPVGGVSPVRMLTSTDGGTSWDTVRSISPSLAGEIRSAAVSCETLAVVYATPYKEVLRSTNRGLTWSQTNDSLNYFARVALSPGVLHLVQGNVEVEYRRSLDLGTTWQEATIISEVDGFTSDNPTIKTSGDSLLLAVWRDAKYGCFGIGGCSIIGRKGVSREHSTEWEPERTLTEAPRGNAAVCAITRNRYAVAWVDEIVPFTTFHAALRMTAAMDTTLCPVVDLTPTTEYAVITVDVALATNAIHVVWEQNVAPSPGTFRIFYRRGRFVTTDVREDPHQIPRLARLEQNYPNPFNPTTTLSYTLKRREFVRLTVYDVLGRHISTLVSEQKEPGEHIITWDAEGKPAGVYYYRLTSGGGTQMRKAILLR